MIISIFDLPTKAQTLSSAIEDILTWSIQNNYNYICTCTVYNLMLAQKSDPIFNALSNATMLTADGMPIVWLQRIMGFPDAERVYGPDLVLALCEHGQNLGIKHYFCGGLPGVAEKLSLKLAERFVNLEVVGFNSLGTISLEEIPVDSKLAEEINQSHANIVWVGLGSPKQDLWMATYRPHLQAPLLIGVGAAFDFLSDTKAQAPLWIRNRGLEWLFRLVNEPKRLAERYLVYNTLFLGQLLVLALTKFLNRDRSK